MVAGVSFAIAKVVRAVTGLGVNAEIEVCRP